jgi:hypothetical protein
MPRRQKDPIHDVVDYFETASIESAKIALEVGKAIVSRRGGKTTTVVKGKTPPQAKKIGPGPAPATVGD